MSNWLWAFGNSIPKVRRFGSNLPFGPTGFIVEVNLDDNEAKIYWGTQDRNQHVSYEKLSTLLIVNAIEEVEDGECTVGDLPKEVDPEKPAMEMATPSGRKENRKWWRGLQRQGRGQVNGVEGSLR